MAHEFPIKEVALQAGLSLATVDRVLNGRSGVRVGSAASAASGYVCRTSTLTARESTTSKRARAAPRGTDAAIRRTPIHETRR